MRCCLLLVCLFFMQSISQSVVRSPPPLQVPLRQSSGQLTPIRNPRDAVEAKTAEQKAKARWLRRKEKDKKKRKHSDNRRRVISPAFYSLTLRIIAGLVFI